jgi:rubrerythrin
VDTSRQAAALRKAIDGESQARGFYQDVAARVVQRRVKRRVGAMARDEAAHEAALKARLARLGAGPYEPDPDAPKDPKFAVAGSAVYEKAVAMEIVSVGIWLETESIRQYASLREAASSAEERRFFAWLERFEQRHRDRLQREYHALERGGTWLN